VVVRGGPRGRPAAEARFVRQHAMGDEANHSRRVSVSMPAKRTVVTRYVRIIVSVAATCLGGALTWYLSIKDVPPGRAVLIVLGLLALMRILLRTGVWQAPERYATSSLGERLRTGDVLRFVASFAGAVVWAALVARRVGDTTAGVAVLVTPIILLFATGMFFLGRALFFSRPKAQAGRQ